MVDSTKWAACMLARNAD